MSRYIFDVSVVLPVYNGERYLWHAINSVLTQSLENLELIIINDGSQDKTSEIISKFTDSRIKIINHKANCGIVSSLNEGIQVARGKYIARMDADDVSIENRLTVEFNFLECNPEYAAVGTFTQIIDTNHQLLYTIEQPTRDQAIKHFMLTDSCIAHGSVMIRSSCIVEVGGYSADKRVVHAEDYDLFVRLATHYKLANIPEYLYQRLDHAQSISHQYSHVQTKSAHYISKLAKKNIQLQQKPDISLLMPTYNKGKYIREAIESILSQRVSSWELVIIDDGSTDETESIIRPYLHDPRIIYLKNPYRLGEACTRNRLVKESLADIIGELDGNDTLTQDALKTMISAHKKNPDYGLIYSQFVYCDVGLKENSIGICRTGKKGETNLHHQYASAFRTYKRKYFEQTSGYDVHLAGAEDIDMVYKLEEVAPILFVNKVLYKYRLVNSSTDGSVSGMIALGKAKIFAYKRRRTKKQPNISLIQLISQLANLSYSIIRQMIYYQNKKNWIIYQICVIAIEYYQILRIK